MGNSFTDFIRDVQNNPSPRPSTGTRPRTVTPGPVGAPPLGRTTSPTPTLTPIQQWLQGTQGGAGPSQDRLAEILSNPDAFRVDRVTDGIASGTSGGGGDDGGGIFGRIWDATKSVAGPALDVIDTPRSAVVSTIKEGIDWTQGEGFDTREWMQQTQDNIGFQAVVEDLGIENRWVKMGLGFAGDVLLDPTTYLTGGLNSANKGAQAANRAFDLATAAKAAGRTDDFNRLSTLGAKIINKGGTKLSADDVRYLQAMDTAARVAGEATPEFLKGGLRLNVPGTGRLAQRVAGRTGGGITQAKTIQIAPQAVTRFTPRGGWQAARAAQGKMPGASSLRKIVDGDFQGLKEMIRSGTPEEMFDGYHGLQAAGLYKTSKHGFEVAQGKALADLNKRVGDADTRLFAPALGGNQAAIDQLGPEVMDALNTWRTQLRDAGNQWAGAEFAEEALFKNLSTWSPSRYSETFQEFLAKTDLSKFDEADAVRTIDPTRHASRIKDGETYLGTKLLKASDPASGGLSPREQAEQIFAKWAKENGHEGIESIFEEDFFKSATAAILHASDQVGLERMHRHMGSKGVGVDLADRLSSVGQSGIANAEKNLDAIRKKIAINDGRRASIAAAVKERVSKREVAAQRAANDVAAARRPVERLARGKSVIDDVVETAEAARDGAIRARDDLNTELIRGVGGRQKQINKILNKLRQTEGKVTRQIGKLEKGRENVFAEIQKLKKEAAKMSERGALGELPGINRRIDGLRKQIADIDERTEVYRQWAGANLDDVATKKAIVGQVDEQVDEITERIAQADQPFERQALRDERIALLQVKADAQEFIDTYEGILADLPGGGSHTEFAKQLARSADAIERMEKVFGLDITQEAADMIIRDMRTNPQSAFRMMMEEAAAALDGADLQAFQDDLAHLERYANTPVSVPTPTGNVYQNLRNSNNEWGYHEAAVPSRFSETQVTAMTRHYGPVMTTRHTDVPLSDLPEGQVRDPRSGKKVPANNQRYQVSGESARIYPDGVKGAHFDALEAALSGGLRPDASWGKGWGEVAEMVRSGRTLKSAMLEVMPFQTARRDALNLVEELVDGPALSAYAKQRMSKLFRQHLNASGFDSFSWATPDGNWHLVPLGREQVVRQMGDMPDSVAGTLADRWEAQIMANTENQRALQNQFDIMGASVDELNNVQDFTLPQVRERLTRELDELDEELDKAIIANETTSAEIIAERQMDLAEAIQLQEAAARHLEEAERILADTGDMAAYADELMLSEIAAYEGRALQVEAKLKKRHNRKGGYKSELKKAEAELAKLKKTKPDTFEAVLGRGMHQIGWRGDRAISNRMAEAIQARTTLKHGEVVKHFDAFVTAWRAAATTSPGFHTRNYMGGVINNLSAGINPASYQIWGDLEGAYRKELKRNAQNPLAAAERARDAMRSKHGKLADHWFQIHMTGVAEGGQFDELALAASSGLKGFNQKDGVAKTVWRNTPFSARFLPYRMSRRAGGRVEGRLRGALALDTIAKGGTIEDAVNQVHKYHFDYTDLSNAERNKLHRAASFYTWTRKNLPLQLEMFFDNPVAFQRYVAIQRNLEYGLDEETDLADYVGKWQRIALPWKSNQLIPWSDTDSRVYLTPDTPFSDLTTMTNLDGILNATNPLAKSLLEIGTQRNLFTGQDIEGETKKISPAWGAIPGFTSALEDIGLIERDADGTPRMRADAHQFISTNLPLLGTAHRLFHPKGDDAGERTAEHMTASWVSWLFGGRSYINTPSARRSTLFGRAFDLRDRAEALEKRGFEDEAEELWDAHYDALDAIDAEFGE